MILWNFLAVNRPVGCNASQEVRTVCCCRSVADQDKTEFLCSSRRALLLQAAAATLAGCVWQSGKICWHCCLMECPDLAKGLAICRHSPS